jgi:hypothetical protein
MAALTRKQTAEIEAALTALLRAKAFIDSPHIAICRASDAATTTLHYTKQSAGGPAALYPITKEAGSDWCLADDAARRLTAFLRNHTK